MDKRSCVESISDDALMERWKLGDLAAGGVLVRRHQPTLRRYFWRAVAGPEREDLVQETFAQVARSMAGFRGQAQFKTFLRCIAHNVLQDHLRARYRRHAHLQVELPSERLADESGDPIRALVELERFTRIEAALARLSPERRALLGRYYWGEGSGRELARTMGLPQGTIRRRAFDAKKALIRGMAVVEPHQRERGSESQLDDQLEQLRELLSYGPPG